MIKLGRKALVVGISGASSSGKTTLSRLLRDIFPNAFILHEDDFYKDDKEWVVISPSLFAFWDCARSVKYLLLDCIPHSIPS